MNAWTHEIDPSRPRLGRSVTGAVVPLARGLLAAVAELEKALPRSFRLAWLDDATAQDRLADHSGRRIAWNIAAIAVLNAITTSRPIGFGDSLRWFGDPDAGRVLDRRCLGAAEDQLAQLVSNREIASLFPYLLDTYGPTSRLDVIRDATLGEQRAARKDAGSFYTPSDVAEFMVATIMGPKPLEDFWFDPACGSGVFLVAVLRAVQKCGVTGPELRAFAKQSLHGADISPQALDFAAFAVCQKLLPVPGEHPLDLWRAIRRNFVAVDALEVVQRRPRTGGGQIGLENLFGTIGRPIRLICNPPYAQRAPGPMDQSWASLAGASARKTLYLPFVEMAWRLADGPDDKAALVVPLAIATNTAQDHARCREALQAAGGDWSMLFFDRQPHALFGEDAKTRSAILIRRSAATLVVRTSRLLKWTSRQRPTIFNEDRAVVLTRPRIKRLVPKLGSEGEARLYELLGEFNMRSQHRPDVASISPGCIADQKGPTDVFVGGTAYNFLNLCRDYPSPRAAGGSLSSSALHRLTFSSNADGRAGYAILASRVAFWLWHAECDGFHVPAWFLANLPLFDLPFSPTKRSELAELGDAIWQGAKQDLLASNNADKWTFAFRPTLVKLERARVDALILEALGASQDELQALSSFEEGIVSVDGTERLARTGEYEKLIMGALGK